MLGLTLVAALLVQDPQPVRYRVHYEPETPGRVAVEIAFPEAVSVLVMPRAIPMGYGEVPYDRFVVDLQAFAASGAPLTVAKEAEGPRWRLGEERAAARSVRYSADLEAMEGQVLAAADASKARPGYLGLLGYSVFAFAEGLQARGAELEVQAPEAWPVFLTLAPSAPPATGAAKARAADFYALADSQVAMGPDLQVATTRAKVPLFVAHYAECESDAESLGRQAARALDALVAWFGTAPFPHYTVHAEFLRPRSPRHRYGFSMEHLQSCTLYLDSGRAPAADDESQATQHLYNLAHHIAHAWIPKRCAGPGYFPWTWEVAPVLDSIWFSEGWGQYAAAAALAEDGGLGEHWRQELVRRRFRVSLRVSPAFLNGLDLVQVSRIASTRYSEDFRTGRNVFARGGLMAYEIDEAIRAATGGDRSLRDLVRTLLAEGARGPLDLDALPALCRQATGADIGEIYRRWLGPVR